MRRKQLSRSLPSSFLSVLLPFFLACGSSPESSQEVVSSQELPPVDKVAASAATPMQKPPCVIVYLVDTLRADRLGCLGQERPLTPEIDAFAQDAEWVGRAVAHAPWTKPSAASIFTGQGPLTHGVNPTYAALPGEAETLAEILQADGYETIGWISNHQVGKVFGFEQGFDEYHQLQGDGANQYHGDSAREVGAAAIEWLTRRSESGREQPFFLYLHTIEPHAPYVPPESHRQRFASEVETPPLAPKQKVRMQRLNRRRAGDQPSLAWSEEFGSISWLNGLARGWIEPTPKMTEDLIALYDAEVAGNDEEFGRLLRHLEKIGLRDECLIALLSDHGEEFHENGDWQHSGRSFFPELIDVPFILDLPGEATGLSSSHPMVRQIDLMPTILDALGLPIPSQVEGVSLLSRSDDETYPAFSYVEQEKRHGVSIVDGGYQLVRWFAPVEEVALYDHSAAPGERRDLKYELPQVARRLEGLLRERTRIARKAQVKDVEIDEETRRRLEALGYL